MMASYKPQRATRADDNSCDLCMKPMVSAIFNVGSRFIDITFIIVIL